MISVERSFYTAFPAWSQGRARSLTQPVVSLLRRVICEAQINQTVADLAHLRGLPFVAAALDYLAFSYRVAPTDRAHLPAEGRVLVVANHPLGGLDALALIDLVGSVRSDVRIVGNRVLRQIAGLGDLLIDCDVFAGEARAGLREVYRALEREQAVILFPAGEVSRVRPQGIRDGRWAPGFARFAARCGAPVVPVHIDAHNSPAFYSASMLAKPLGTLMLPRQLFAARDSRISLSIGHPVAAADLQRDAQSSEQIAAAMRDHVYRLARRKPPRFTTSRSVAHPLPPLRVRDALERGRVLGQTSDGKRIVLLPGDSSCPALLEVGRLRELAFRRVGEGTGLPRDLDRHDPYYQHLLLWDDARFDIVGAYRLGEAAPILAEHGLAGLYSSSLFDYRPEAGAFLDQAVELGRSFVQPKYWGTRSLDYLWQGIGAFLRSRPGLRNLIGPVSLSRDLPDEVRHWIMAAHRHYFGATPFAAARNPARVPAAVEAAVGDWLHGLEVEQGLAELRRRVQARGVGYPVLYRQYADLCQPDGLIFADFGVDPAFGHCIDGLVRVDLQRLKPHKRSRYIEGVRGVAATAAV